MPGARKFSIPGDCAICTLGNGYLSRDGDSRTRSNDLIPDGGSINWKIAANKPKQFGAFFERGHVLLRAARSVPVATGDGELADMGAAHSGKRATRTDLTTYESVELEKETHT